MQLDFTRSLVAVLVIALGMSIVTPTAAQDAPPDAPKVRQPRVKPKPGEPAPAQPAEVDPDDQDMQADPSAPAAPGSKTVPGTTLVQPPAPAGAPPTVKSPGPYILREKQKDLTLTVNVTVRPDSSKPIGATRGPNGKTAAVPDYRNFTFDTLSMVFPLPAESSSALPDTSSLKGKLLLDDRAAFDSKNQPVYPVLLDKQISGELYHSGTRLMRFGTDRPATCREIGMEFEIKYRCWNTQFDEAAAMQVDWPKGEIPVVSKATMAPQIFVNYSRTRGDGGPVTSEFDTKLLTSLVATYTNGNPRGARPVVAAKYIAGRIAADFQTTGSGLQFLSTGELQGFNLQGVPATIQNRKGSEFDINSVLVAALREAGLPARLMIGYDLGEEDKKVGDFLGGGNRGTAKLMCWTEFGLYDEARRTLTWIPIDVVRLRKASSRMAPMDRPWKYFGTHDELNHVVPMAFGFHPPTTVESYGAPGLWGWLMTPQPPETAYQAIRFRASSTAKTADDAAKEAKKKKREKDGN